MSDYTPARGVLLARISDSRNGDTHGVDGQVAALRDEANRRGWTIGPDATHVLVENDTSAFTRHATCPSCMKRTRECPCPVPADGQRRTVLRTWRPKFRQALDMLKSGEADGLLVLDLDRAMRDPRDLEDLIDVVRERTPDVAVDSITGSLRELHTSSGQQTARILIGVAVKSSEDTARRVAAKRKSLAHDGCYAGGRRPYGYTPDPDAVKYHKTLLVVEDEAAEIKRWADQILAGASLRAITADLRERRVPSVTGATWDTATVRDVLIKPSVAGLAVHDVRGAVKAYRKRGEPVPYDAGVTGKASWPAILPEETWRAVASKLTDPARRTSPQGSNAPRWFGSLIYRCGVCAQAGVEETVSISAGSTERDPRYKCRRSGHLLRAADRVDTYVTDELLRHLSTTAAAKLIPQPEQTDKDALRKEADVLRQRRATVVSLVADGTFTAEEARAQAKPLNDRLAEIDRLITVTVERSPLDALPIGNAVRVPGVSGTGARRKAELLEAAQAMREAWDKLPIGHKRAILRKTATVTLLRGKPGRYPSGSYFNGSETIRIDWL